MTEVVRRFGDSPGWRRSRTLAVLAVLLLGVVAPSLESLAAPADDGCCTGVCEDGCCFLGEKARQRLHEERRERARSQPRNPAFEAQTSCPDDWSALPSASPVPAAPEARQRPRAVEAGPDFAAPGRDGRSAASLVWHPDAPRGPPPCIVS